MILASRQKVISQLSLVSAPTLAFFSLLHYLKGCCHVLSAIEGVLAALLVLMPWSLRRGASIHVVENILMICAVALFSALVIFESVEDTGAYWMAGFPFIAYFIHDAKTARYWVGCFIAGLFATAALAYAGLVTVEYSGVQIFYIASACLFFWLFAHLYKSDLEGRQARLEAANRALNEQQIHTKVILDNAPIGIWKLDTNRRMQFLNRAWVQWLGVSEEQAKSLQEYTAALPEDVARQCIDSDVECLEDDAGVCQLRQVIPCADGREHVFDIIKVRVSNEAGRPDGLVGFAIDVTERLAAEEKQRKLQMQMQHAQRLESVGVLAGGIAHDFNNLLTAMQGHAELARLEQTLSPAMVEHIDCIEEASRAAADLCQQMLAYAGKGKFVLQHISLTDLVRNMQKLIESSVGKHVHVDYRLDEHMPTIAADVSQIRQVLLNMVINASEAIPEGQDGRITIATGAMGADESYFTETYIGRGIIEDSYAYLEVSDNGCGMDAETQEKMFDPFFSTKFAGRGLGMSAVVGIVQGHDGMLKVDSRPGQGTTMRASFPCSAGQPSAISPADTRATKAQGLSGKVLVVDDEKAVLRVAKKMLERMGLEVVEAGDGQEGVETFRRHKDDIACVLLDMSMPNMDGISCMAKLRRIKPAVKVLMSSGYNEEEMIKRLEGAMPEGFLKKPYTFEALQQKLGEIMSLDGQAASLQ